MPTLETEHSLIGQGAASVGGMDEVGRGALAGPVCVGVVAVDAETPPPPTGLADSKLLTRAQRLHLVPRLAEWGIGRSLGWASAPEVDQHGIVGALHLAGRRALAGLGQWLADAPGDGPAHGPALRPAPGPETIILDGKHNWLSPAADLFAAEPEAPWRVHMKVKADLRCASVAAASVLAKVARDARMDELAQAWPDYGWEANKGYGSPAHLAALRRHGPSPEHRQSWALPSQDGPDVRG
ncbi:MAG: ribonuclease HII [Bifidobacteriaceae bacterium]|nr:ribonuclease HII [Bifidobacteriaceae bacterium]